MARHRTARSLLATIAFACAASAGQASHAHNGPPAILSVKPHPTDAEVIYVPATFGLLKSSDGGDTFQWICELAVGDDNMIAPDYALTPGGDIYVTTKLGLRVSRDAGCTFESAGFDETKFISELEVGPDGRIWIATATGAGQNDVYVSDGASPFQSSNLFEEKARWASLRTTPADPNRLYVTGLLPPPDKNSDATALLRRSLDGGQTWEDLPVGDFIFDDSPNLELADVSPVDADVLFARSLGAVQPLGDALYRSSDGGLTWVLVAEFADSISAFHIRPDGQTVVAATIRPCPEDIAPADAGAPDNGCVRLSSDGGVTWRRPEQQPRLACIGESSDGILFGCGANWEPDFFALGRSTDGEAWSKVYRFSETAGPLECPAGTEQATCAVENWPGLCNFFGICQTPDAAPPAQDDGTGDSDGDGGPEGGCCRVGDSPDGSSTGRWLPGLLLVLFCLVNRRRSRKTKASR
jgi:photosystem II stability/assembly factor-like uncharacterized protein